MCVSTQTLFWFFCFIFLLWQFLFSFCRGCYEKSRRYRFSSSRTQDFVTSGTTVYPCLVIPSFFHRAALSLLTKKN
jgi:hypothetical protein